MTKLNGAIDFCQQQINYPTTEERATIPEIPMKATKQKLSKT
jgi:hypothetical protein